MGRNKSQKQSSGKSEPTLNSLILAAKETTRDHLRSSGTNLNYARYVDRIRKWAESEAAKLRENENAVDGGASIQDAAPMPSTISADDLESAFDLVPNSASPQALISYITFKCIEEGNKHSTADSSRAACKAMWEQTVVNGVYQYRGAWKLDSTTNSWIGNPADAHEVKDFMDAHKHKSKANGDPRDHSAPMTSANMESIYKHIMEVLKGLPQPLKTLEENETYLKYHLYLAFSTTAWNLWTRGSEALKLKWKHFTMDLMTTDGLHTPYFQVSLIDRKNWQSKLNTKVNGNTYNIYAQPELPHADMYQHVKKWLSILISNIYLRPLESEDFIFPPIGAHGSAHFGSAISHDTLQRMVEAFATSAGICDTAGRFTTHCFCRGGAQYRFMSAPPGKRWPLTAIRWWGGWANGEQIDTLVRYLVDEVHQAEATHQDALRPLPLELNNSFMGEARQSRPVTVGEMETMLNVQRETVQNSFNSVFSQLIGLQTSTSASGAPSGSVLQLPSTSGPVRQGELASTLRTVTYSYSRSANKLIRSSAASQLPVDAFPTGLVIPGVPKSVKDPGERWKWWVKDWQSADPARGLAIPLKDWDKKWITTDHRGRFGMKYFHRKTVAEEFLNACEGDEGKFKTKWAEHLSRGPVAVFNAIREPEKTPRLSARQKAEMAEEED